MPAIAPGKEQRQRRRRPRRRRREGPGRKDQPERCSRSGRVRAADARRRTGRRTHLDGLDGVRARAEPRGKTSLRAGPARRRGRPGCRFDSPRRGIASASPRFASRPGPSPPEAFLPERPKPAPREPGNPESPPPSIRHAAATRHSSLTRLQSAASGSPTTVCPSC